MSTIDLAEMTAILKRRTDTAHLRVATRVDSNDPWPGSLYSFGGYYEVFDDNDGGPDVPYSNVAEVYRWWTNEKWNAAWRCGTRQGKIDRTFDTPAQALSEAIAAWRYYKKENQQ